LTWSAAAFGPAVEERQAEVHTAVAGGGRHPAAAGVPARRGQPACLPESETAGMPVADLRWTWELAKRAAGLPADLRIHDLRHSFASVLANAGVSLFEMGTVLGHRQLATTTRYAHHAPARLVETASTAARAWNLLPGPADGAEQP
jgi:integrase